MINFIFQITIMHILLIPLGVYFIKSQENKFITYSTQLIYAIILISFLALLFNFFSPLNSLSNSFFLVILFILTFKKWKNYLNFEYLFFLFFSTFIVSLLILESNVYRPDAGLYHLPYINILNEEKIVFGLSNLHFRYAHTSILQHTSAFLNNYLLGVNGIVLPSALLFSAIIINFTSRIYQLIKLKRISLELYFLIFVQIFIFYKMNRYSEYGNDAPSHLLFFFLFSKILEIKERSVKENLNLILLILFIIQNKIILIFSVLTIPIFFKKNHVKKIFKEKRFYFINLFFIIWIMKNIVVSGCLIFPLTSVCMENFKWSNKAISESTSIENEAWAKGWPDYVKKYKDNKQIQEFDIKTYSKKFNWLQTWSKNHLKKIFNIIIPYIFLLCLFLFFILQTKNKYENNFKHNEKKIIFLTLFILTISCICWFIKVPVFRYGYSYLISFLSVTFGYLGLKYFKIRENLLKRYLIILTIGSMVLISKNFIRIIDNPNDYKNYPWPKFYSMDDAKNTYPKLEEFYISEKKFYKPSKDNYCMYFKSPCINYGNYLNAKILIKNSYYIAFLD